MKYWNDYDVFVLSLPTGAGKSLIAIDTIAATGMPAHIVTPSNLLVQQYLTTFSDQVKSIQAQDKYYCSTYSLPLSQKRRGKLCAIDECLGCARYARDLTYVRTPTQSLVNNYWAYTKQLRNGGVRPLLIIDEAHTLLSVLSQLHSHHWFLGVTDKHLSFDQAEIRELVNSLAATYEDNKTFCKLRDALNNDNNTYIFKVVQEWSRGKTRAAIQMSNIDVRLEKPILWPAGQVRKIVLMSATIGKKDIEQMGLANRRVIYLAGQSPIGRDARPLRYPQSLAINLNYANTETALPLLAKSIQTLSDRHVGEKGVIHLTYSLAADIKKYLSANPRFLFHTKFDKDIVYQKFRASNTDSVLVASGMYEGIDLPYEYGRWQVIGKVPWPSLGSSAVKYMAERDEEWYVWQAMKSVIQAAGRTTRAEDDFSIVYILDSTFKYKMVDKYASLFPMWFLEALSFE